MTRAAARARAAEPAPGAGAAGAGRWRGLVALAAGAAMALLAISLARVDTGIGAPAGADRLAAAADATPTQEPADVARAREALRARPVDGAAYRILAQAAGAAGDGDTATGLYVVAARRWPRERIAQASLADRAFESGDIEAGLQRVDALLRVAPSLRAGIFATLLPHLDDARIRDGLGERLAADPPWRRALVESLRAESVPAAPAEALLAGLAERAPLAPQELQVRLLLLERLGRPQQARAAWLATLAPDDRAAAGLVFDGGFEHPGVEGGYGWQFDAPPGTAIAIEDADAREGNAALAIRFDGRAVQFAGVRQKLALGPGRYRFEVAMRNRVDTARPFVWQLACGDGAGLLELALPVRGGEGWQRLAGDFEVPAGCPGQVLVLRHAGRSLAERRLAGELRVDGVEVVADSR